MRYQMLTPTGPNACGLANAAAVAANTGGALPTPPIGANWNYYITCVYGDAESGVNGAIPGVDAATAAGFTNPPSDSVVVTWATNPLLGVPDAYRIYREDSGAPGIYDYIGETGLLTLTDDGTVAPGGAEVPLPGPRYAIFETTAVSKLVAEYGNCAETVRLMCGVDKYIRQAVGNFAVSAVSMLTTYDILQREQAYRLSNFGVAHADFIVYAKPIGALGDVITIELVAAGALAVNVVGNDITVDFVLGVDNAQSVTDAINAHVAASALVFAAVAEGNVGGGLVGPWARNNLGGALLLGPTLDEYCFRDGERLYVYTRPYGAATTGSAFKLMVSNIDPELAANFYADADEPNGLTEPFRNFNISHYVELAGRWRIWEDPRHGTCTWEVRPA